MKIQKTCLHCGRTFAVWPYRVDTAKYCSRACRQQHTTIELTCAICGKRFTRYRCHARDDTKYCSVDCAYIGQGRTRECWNKGLTKETDPRLANVSRLTTERWADEAYCDQHSGENHHMYGKQHTTEARQKMREARAQQEVTPSMLAALDTSHGWDKGLTKNDHPAIARRARTLSGLYKDKPNPAHSKRMKKYYRLHPDKHPNRIMAKKGHETLIERLLRLAMEKNGLSFEAQHPVGSRIVDFAFPDLHLAIEADGEHWHTAEQDKKRDEELAAEGWTVIHFSGSEIKEDPHQCVSTVLDELLRIVDAN